MSKYEADQFFGLIFATLYGECPQDPKLRSRLELMLSSFSRDEWRLLHKEELCVPSHSCRQEFEMAHDSRVDVHFAFAKTLARLTEFLWKHKTKDVKQNCEGFSTR